MDAGVDDYLAIHKQHFYILCHETLSWWPPTALSAGWKYPLVEQTGIFYGPNRLVSWAVPDIGTPGAAGFIPASRQRIDNRGQFRQNLSLS